MASFNPSDPHCLVITGKDIYKYYKIIDNQTMKCQVNQLTKKESNFSTQYNAHTWTDDRLILYTEKGEILLAEQEGDFKMLMSESPVGNFKIRYAMNSKPNGFLIADNSGRLMVFELTNDPKAPYHATKTLVSACL
jgi:hypothetical protein